MIQSVVQLRGITKTYRIGRDITVNALRGIDLDIRPAEFVDHLQRSFDRLEHAIERRDFVRLSVKATFGRGTVIT